MSCADKVKAILPNPTILVSNSTLSYVKCLMPKLKTKETLLLHKELQVPLENLQHNVIVSDDSETNELDMTGSPLSSKLECPVLDETIVDYRNWKKEEEFHSPLAKFEAREALNCCHEYLDYKSLSSPLLAICDGRDNDKTILLGSEVRDGWLTTIQAQVLDAQRLTNIEKLPSILFAEYTKMFSVPKHKVCVAVSSIYELCGKRPGITDSTDHSSSNFSGSLSVEVNWKTLSFYAPIRDFASTLVMEIIAGWNESYLQNLWKELKTLEQYMNMFEQCGTDEQNSLSFAFASSAIWDEINGKLHSLLNGEDETQSYNVGSDDDQQYVTDDEKFRKHIDNVQFRQNRDFGDILWELLISCSDHAHVTCCFWMVLQEIQLSCAEPQIIITNSTRLKNLISDILHRKSVVPKLCPKSLLELIIDAGLEKLSRDYTYVLLSTNLMGLPDIQEALDNVRADSFDIESCRKKLISLAQIHLCLEFTLHAQNYLHCPTSDLKLIFNNAFEEYTCKNSNIKSFLDLSESKIQCLEVPLPTIVVEEIARELPSSWCLTLSSESNTSKITTTSYLSRTPILPPNIFCFDESEQHDIYHCLKLDLSSIKIA